MKTKKLLYALFGTLLVGGMSAYMLAYASSGEENLKDDGFHPPRQEQQLTDEEKADRLIELESLTFDSWKEEQIERINNSTEEQFNEMKERQQSFLEGEEGDRGQRGHMHPTSME